MMEVETIGELLLANLKIKRGRIVAFSVDGEIKVESQADDLPISCEFLQMAAGSPPELCPGDAVLYAMDEMALRGYVIGVIQKYHPEGRKVTANAIIPDPEQKIREIRLTAEEKLELSCGKSSLTLNEDGKIVIKGTNLLSRSSGPNRIIGASVAIN